MALEELNDLPLHYFQTADEMNVIISKRLAEQQVQLAPEGILWQLHFNTEHQTRIHIILVHIMYFYAISYLN